MIQRLGLCAATTCMLFAFVACGEKKPAAAASEPPVDLSQATKMFDATAPAEAAPEIDPTTVVAVVNGADVTQADVTKELMTFLQRMRGRVPPERLNMMRGELELQSRDAVITKKLLEKAVEDEKVVVTDADIDEAIEKFKANSQPGVTLEDALARNNMTMESFRTTLAADLRINKLLEGHVKEASKPTDEEIQNYYDTNKQQFTRPESVTASHILITTEETDTPEMKEAKKAKLAGLRQKLLDGEDFAECASKNSDCPSKAQGGNLGEFHKGQMVKPFEDAAFSQKIDEVGPVIETQFGYHIIKVTDHKEAGTIALDEVKDKLSQYLASQKNQLAAQAYVEELKSKAQITYPGQSAPAPSGG